MPRKVLSEKGSNGKNKLISDVDDKKILRQAKTPWMNSGTARKLIANRTKIVL